ncbi:DUF309 domain-containing protein [Streptomyces pacificus]|uniref:DUF309 domain-containing protein n=1 Tax=Streptomyces pacificus TaxID=2705029 RepID=A0A6A0B0D4_9ACTN|nr:DUF309 domain-containing protein [Streptomyces pacificus]
MDRQPEGVVRPPGETLTEAQRLLDVGMPFHAHEVLEDAWKSGPDEERGLWRGLAQLAVGLTHAARGNAAGSAALLARGAESIAPYAGGGPCGAGEAQGTGGPYGIDVAGLTRWAAALEDDVRGDGGPVSPAARAPRLRMR